MSNNSILVSAAAKGDLLLLERTLGGEHGDFSEEDISMALLRAACLGNATCVSRLLAHGADPDCEDLDGDTPLMLAATNNHIGVVRLLLATGCDVDQQSDRRRTALHMAAWHERLKVVRLLLEANCDGDLRDRYGDTALMLASRKGHLEIMQLLLTYGCDIKKTSHENDTALHYAAKNGRSECIVLLLSLDPDIEARTAWGYTPLMVAAMSGCTEAALVLIGAGANIHAVDRAEKGPLRYSVKANLPLVVDTLLELGADPDALDVDGNTALVDALVAGHMSLVRLLVRYGCDVHRVGKATVGRAYRPCRPLELAVGRRLLEAAKLLHACGAKFTEFMTFEMADIGKDFAAFRIAELVATVTKGEGGGDSTLGNWITRVQSSPHSLADVVRIRVRQLLGRQLILKVRVLPLPAILRTYLSYSNESEFQDER